MLLPIETEAGLILPGHPFFDEYLYGTLPPDWRDYAYHNPDFAFVARAGSGMLEAVTEAEMVKYVEGGEYDQWLEESGQDDDNYG
ncbi:MAG: hypothetical protein KME23_17655 [Goleter apudmare HA4340-LM2]|jgi:hypothetical protein|nr:hypothetical protein [Goleter apudmare HA4340-LM2]MBW4644787.1 hypothetical protein [Goleter apudmare HA4340-LM2]